MIRIARSAHDFRHINDDDVFRESKFKTDMQRLLYNTARNLVARELHAVEMQRNVGETDQQKRSESQSSHKKSKPAAATATSAAGDRGNLQRWKGMGRNASAYDRLKFLIDGGISLVDFRADLQMMMNIWLQSKKKRKVKAKVEELLTLLEGTQEDGPWQETVEEWKPYLEDLPANH